MEDEKDVFYVVRKGDIVGVYKNFSDFQPLLYGPNVAVFKGYRLPKAAEEYLATHGLNKAIYSIGTSDVQSQLFGQLVPCPFQQPPFINGKTGTRTPADNWIKKKAGSTSIPESSQRKLPEIESFMETLPVSAYVLMYSRIRWCIKRKPWTIRCWGGAACNRWKSGLGVATNNVAEYRAVILGLRCALERGFRHIRVQGDSKLVCMQVNGLWKTKTENMTSLCKVAKELKHKFASFQICHVEREFNTEADAQANMGIHLQVGEVQEEVERR